jgi:hypothetical protein
LAGSGTERALRGHVDTSAGAAEKVETPPHRLPSTPEAARDFQYDPMDVYRFKFD